MTLAMKPTIKPQRAQSREYRVHRVLPMNATTTQSLLELAIWTLPPLRPLRPLRFEMASSFFPFGAGLMANRCSAPAGAR